MEKNLPEGRCDGKALQVHCCWEKTFSQMTLLPVPSRRGQAGSALGHQDHLIDSGSYTWWEVLGPLQFREVTDSGELK